jgi:hypothetical protein
METAEQEAFDKGVLAAVDEGVQAAAPTTPPPEPAPKVEAAQDQPDLDLDAPPIEMLEAEEAAEAATKEAIEPTPEASSDDGEETVVAAKADDGASPDAEKDTAAPADEPSVEAAATPEPVKPAAEAKPSDEFGELPEDAKAETKERFGNMKVKFDEQAEQLAHVQGQNDQWMEEIKRSGATPEQYAQSLMYLEQINSGTPEGLENAYKIMQGELEVLGKALGKEVPGYDPLSDYPELQTRVDEGYLDRKDALELASGRARVKHRENMAAAKANGATTMSAEEGIQSLSVLGQQLRANDPQYDAKLEYLKPLVSAAVKSGADPSTWAKTVQIAYDNLPEIASPSAPAPKPTAPNTIRPTSSGGTGGMTKEPGSALEALDQSLARGY